MSEWSSFIASQQAQRVDNEFISATSGIGVVLVSGEDATDFLQNQFSNDVSAVTETHYQLDSYSTPKGRMLAIFRVLKISNGYLLFTSRSVLQQLLTRLHMFVLRSQVNLADASDYFCGIAVKTANNSLLNSLPINSEALGAYQDDDVISLTLPEQDGQQRLLLFYPDLQKATDCWNHLAEHLSVADFASFRLSEIRSATPMVYPETSEEFVLQMVNLGALGGVSFKKGCYPGQEIVARMQYLGKLKRRMYLAEVASDEVPAPGDELVVNGKTEADGSGKVVDAERGSDGHCHCLFVARIDRADNDELVLLKNPTATITRQSLPYSLEVS